MGKWIEILKTGTFTAKNGKEVTITDEDLKNIAMSNPEKDRDAPLVFGHPEDDEPAFGWLQKVKKSGNILKAKFRNVPKAVKQIVKDGYYKKVSVALRPDKKSIKHVGLLGAVQPAVAGLADVDFSDEEDDQIVIEFSGSEEEEEIINNNEESEAMSAELRKQLDEEKAKRMVAEDKAAKEKKRADEKENELSAQADKQTEKEISEKIGKLIGKQILPKDKDLIQKIALSLGKDDEEIELSEGAGKKSLTDHLFSFLSGLPDLGLTSEFSQPEGDDGEDLDTDLSDCV
ncbi:MAG: hypothetical protein GY760_21185 [Deltaproteobacteria bacterium]|nr:hypothetical protein [Deltaproteobacteria bacterium]